MAMFLNGAGRVVAGQAGDLLSDVVLARFVLSGAACVVVPQAAADASLRLGSFELAGHHYAVIKIGEEPSGDLLDLLTPRELQIAVLVAAGQESKVVAHRLRISFHTVRVHLGRIYAKLGLHKQTELAALVSARYGALKECCFSAALCVLPLADMFMISERI
jgi:DNA-binding NarL/FixJ family response regulator